MSNHKNRLLKLEKRADEQPLQRPKVIEIWGSLEDGTRYLMETRTLSDEATRSSDNEQSKSTT